MIVSLMPITTASLPRTSLPTFFKDSFRTGWLFSVVHKTAQTIQKVADKGIL